MHSKTESSIVNNKTQGPTFVARKEKETDIFRTFSGVPRKNKPGNRERNGWANEKSPSIKASIKVCLKKIQIIAITKRK